MNSLLDIVNNVAVEVGLEETTSVLNGDLVYKQIARLVQREGKELSRYAEWRFLKRSGQITGDGSTTLWPLPSDMDRLMPGLTIWEYGRPFFPLIQVSDADMLALKNAVSSPIRPVWRLVEGDFEFYRAPSSGMVLNYEYRTKYWLTDSTGVTEREAWEADSDIPILPDYLLELGGIWRFLKAKGRDYAEAFRSAQMERAKAARSDNALPTITMSEKVRGTAISMRNAYSVTV